MKSKRKRERISLVAGVLLAVYGSVSVLGYGLHTLWHSSHQGCDHEHHSCDHGTVLAEVEHGQAHDCGDACHASKMLAQDAEPLSSCSADDCSICDFLSQAQSYSCCEVETGFAEVLPTVLPPLYDFHRTLELDTPPGRGPPYC